MALKRHLASTARGLLGFCLMTQIEVQEVQGVQKVQLRLIRLIRLIRGKTEEPILWRTAFQAEVWWCAIYTEGVAPGYSW